MVKLAYSVYRMEIGRKVIELWPFSNSVGKPWYLSFLPVLSEVATFLPPPYIGVIERLKSAFIEVVHRVYRMKISEIGR